MKKVVYLALCSLLVLSACSKGTGDPLEKYGKSELVTMLNNAYDAIAEKDVTIAEQKELLEGVKSEVVVKSGISHMEDGTNRLTFNSIDGKITFPSAFEYPESTQSPNTSSINITTNLTISPTSNWLVKVDGTTLELEHTNGIEGLIKAGDIKNAIPNDSFQEIFTKFFEEFPPEKIVYSKLFLGEQWWGLQAMTPTRIDGEEAYIRCGMVGFSRQCFTYMFLYRGEQNNFNDETILNLIKTIKLYGQELRVES